MALPSSTSSGYRPALDGLRGIAVTAVLVYHLWPSVLPGGWLGVDLFFVLSGYLITSILVREYSARGHLNFARFWRARMRRLLPSLIVVLLAVAAMSAVWTLPSRRGGVGLDILATLGYVANWRLLASNEAYFASVGTPSPLRHAWSLGIEEQYYLLFPMLLATLARWIHRRRDLALAFLTLAVLSAVWMAHLYVPGQDPTRVYYGTDTRAFELLIGAAAGAWLGPRQWGVSEPSRWFSRVRRLGWPALVVLVWAFVVVHEDMAFLFRGGLLVLAVVALVPLLVAASPHPSSLQRALSFEPLRRLGLISYALYLWHWPLHVFLTTDRLTGPSWVPPVVQAALSVLLAAATYRFVERPIRTRGLNGLFPRHHWAPRAVVMSSVAAVVVAAIAMPLAGQLTSNTTEAGAEGGNLHVREPKYHTGDPQNVMFLGNSIPDSLASHFPSDRFPDITLTDATSFGCTPFDNKGEMNDGKVASIPASCADFQQQWTSRLPGQHTMVYFVPQNLLYNKQGAQVLASGTAAHDAWVRTTFDDIKKQADAHHVPHVAFVTLACHRMPTFGDTKGDMAIVDNDAKVRHLNSLIRSWAPTHGVKVIDQYSFLCPGNSYHGRINGKNLYADALHFTDQSGPIMWSWMAPQIQKAST